MEERRKKEERAKVRLQWLGKPNAQISDGGGCFNQDLNLGDCGLPFILFEGSSKLHQNIEFGISNFQFFAFRKKCVQIMKEGYHLTQMMILLV